MNQPIKPLTIGEAHDEECVRGIGYATHYYENLNLSCGCKTYEARMVSAGLGYEWVGDCPCGKSSSEKHRKLNR